jgi:Flp pilus assembly protein TadD
MFRGPDAEPDAPKVKVFGKMLRERYPWLTENSVNVLIEKTRRLVVSALDDETHGISLSRKMEAEGRMDEAIAHLRMHLERDPNNADSWYALGELLCRAGRADEGYKAFARGRDLF